MKLTKCCLFPWSFMQIHGGGMMQPCAVGPDTDLGDFLIDYVEKKSVCEDFLNNEGLQMLRKGMLTGNLRPMCQNCFFVSNDLITVEEFQKRLKEYLSSRLGTSVDLETADLTKVYAYNWMAISFTNRCNLSCIYCVQSTLKGNNPYFKAEIPYEYASDILDMMASKGIQRISTCVEGEATLYKEWQSIFTDFHRKYPQIEMYMTTNLNRRYSDEDLELLVSYTKLDVSMDSLKPELYSYLRRGGKLELLLENLDKIDAKAKEMGVEGPEILLHIVVSDKTWTEIKDIAEFAFSRGYGIQLGNYEERRNTIACQKHILKPINQMDEEEQNEVRDIIEWVRREAAEKNCSCVIQGDIFKKVDKSVEHNYNRFSITDGHPVYKAFLEKYPKGEPGRHFDVVYDRDNISYAGILFHRGESLKLCGLPENLQLVVREVSVYKEGVVSAKYNHRVEPGYRRKVSVPATTFFFEPVFKSDDVEAVLLDVSDWWTEAED